MQMNAYDTFTMGSEWGTPSAEPRLTKSIEGCQRVYPTRYPLLFIMVFVYIFTSINASALDLPKQGPKARVAVAQFGTTDRFASVYGGWNIGGGLSAQLVTALIDSQRVVVVERAILSKVLMEQELGQSRLSSPFTQTPAGQLLGVDYLIVGEVTEFDQRQMGAGGALHIAKGFGPKVSGDLNAAFVGIDIRLIDTRTGEILHSHRAQGRAWEKAMGAKIDFKFIEFGGDLFHKTPLGRGARRAISNAVDFVLKIIDKKTAEFSWLARVIEVDGNDIYFDAGRRLHIEKGDRFKVSSVEKVLTDPETNEILGLVEHPVSSVQASHVELKYTKAKNLGPLKPSIGDLVRFELEKPNRGASPLSPTGYKIMLDGGSQ